VHRVTVPARLKGEVGDKLDQANINERTLFPGLEGLSHWLARYYLPRDTPASEHLPRALDTGTNKRFVPRRVDATAKASQRRRRVVSESRHGPGKS
jgi:hypothetical protein